MSKLTKSAALLSAITKATMYGMHREPIRYWDVGARWGLSRQMQALYRLGLVAPVFFEPDRTEAASLHSRYKRGRVFDCGLWDHCGSETLYVTRQLGQSSLLKPTYYPVAKRLQVQVTRADVLIRNHSGVSPEIVKLDIQGGELAALQGFGDTLDTVAVLEIEVSFENTYTGQPSITDLTTFLFKRGFGLFDLQMFGVQYARAGMQANAFYFRREPRTKREHLVESIMRTMHQIPVRV